MIQQLGTTGNNSNSTQVVDHVKTQKGSANAEAHSQQRSPTFCRVYRYRPPTFRSAQEQHVEVSWNRLLIRTGLRTSAESKVHKDIDEQL